MEKLHGADGLVLGRVTYEHRAAQCPNQDGAYADLVNPVPKYMASRTLPEPRQWQARLIAAATYAARTISARCRMRRGPFDVLMTAARGQESDMRDVVYEALAVERRLELAEVTPYPDGTVISIYRRRR